ncbi:MAG: transglutaminase-like domain-containing protein [Candidatus Nitrospinota bacterium M3_3B_026]
MRPAYTSFSAFLLSFLLFFTPASQAIEFGKTRTFELAYIVKVEGAPAGSSQLNLWAPYITSDEDQTVLDVRVDSPYPVTVNYESRWGNGIMFVSVPNPGPQGFIMKVTYTIERRERLAKNFDYDSPTSIVDKGQFRRYLLPSEWAVINDAVVKFSNQAAAGAKNAVGKARGAYDFILSRMEYNKQIPGWGRGDVNRVCLAIDGGKSGTGNCTDFHSFFGSLMRVQGIPVIFEMGYPLKPEKNQTDPKAGGYHCWAKFFVPGQGWVPVDISEAQKDMSKKEYFWGAICENRVRFSRGRDITLVPAQEGEPLNYFGPDPYIEVDGKKFDGFERLIAYKNL